MSMRGERPLRVRRARSLAWLVMAAALGLPAMVVGLAGASSVQELFVWRPELAARQPWRWWTAAWVHLGPLHLLANLAGAGLVAWLGWLCDFPSRASALAWATSWPLVHLSLRLQEDLTRYVGMSGVLHSGVAVCAIGLVAGAGRRRGERWLGGAMLLGLLAKVALERPWAGPLVHSSGLGIPIAPLAHAAGAAWGVLLGVLALGVRPDDPR